MKKSLMTRPTLLFVVPLFSMGCGGTEETALAPEAGGSKAESSEVDSASTTLTAVQPELFELNQPEGVEDVPGPVPGELEEMLESNLLRDDLERVVELTRDPNPEVRYLAVKATWDFGDFYPDGEFPDFVIDAIVKALADRDASVRSAALLAAVDLFPAHVDRVVPAMNRLLWDPDPKVASSAITKYMHAGPSARELAAPALLAKLREVDDDESTRDEKEMAKELLEALGYVGEWRPLVELAQSEDDWLAQTYLMSRDAIKPLGLVEPATDRIHAVLLAKLADDDDLNRSSALSALAYSHPTSDRVVEAMTALIDSEDEDVRYEATIKLRELKPTSPKVVEALIKAMDRDDTRHAAIWSLSAIGPEAEAAVSRLLSEIGDRDSENRHYALAALGAIGKREEEVVPVLLGAARESDVLVSREAMAALEAFPGSAEKSVPVLLEVVESADGVRREVAMSTLGALGPKSAAAVPRFIAMLDDELLREDAISALGRIGPPSSPAKSKLFELVADEDTAKKAVTALCRIGGDDVKARIPEFIEFWRSNGAPGMVPALWKLDPDAARKAGLPKTES